MSKILFIIDHLGCGGAERITLQLAEYLATQKHVVHIAVLNGAADYHRPSSDITYTDLHFCTKFAYGKMWRQKKLNESEQNQLEQLLLNNFDLIVTGYNNGHWLARYLKGNVWHWIHGDLLEIRKFDNPLKILKEHLRFYRNKRKFKKLFANRNIITVNRDLEHKMKLYAPIKKCQTIANGVSINPNFITQYSSLPKQWDTIYVGRLAPIKQVDHAIKAFAQSGLTGQMAIVGDGSERENLENLVQQLKLTDRIKFLGWVNNPYEYIGCSKSLILTSYYESYGLVLAEALSINTPVISYNSSVGISDIFCCPKMKKYLINKQDKDKLSNQLFNLVNNPYPISNDVINMLKIEKMADSFLRLTK